MQHLESLRGSGINPLEGLPDGVRLTRGAKRVVERALAVGISPISAIDAIDQAIRMRTNGGRLPVKGPLAELRTTVQNRMAQQTIR